MDVVNQTLRKVPEWLVYALSLLPIPVLFVLALQGDLGVDPVKALEHRYGLLGLQFLLATLAVSPVRRLIGLNVMRFRRAFGLIAFSYVAAHLLVWLILDVQALSRIIEDILKRPYITIGMASFALMVPLAVTSRNSAIRRLGARWRKLHRLTYAVGFLAALHFVWLTKGWQIEPLSYAFAMAALLMWRLPWGQMIAKVRPQS